MSTALEIVQSYYAAFNNKDWNGMLAHLDENIQHDVNQGDSRFGIEKYREFLQLMDDAYEETLKDIVFMSEPTGTRVAAEFVVHGVYKKGDEGFPEAHGQTYILPAGAFLEVRNGKIIRVTTYYNLPLWIKLVS